MKPANSLQDKYAPGETRTPNLLIRSQFRAPPTLGLPLKTLQVADAARHKADRKSHNFSHNVARFLAGLCTRFRAGRTPAVTAEQLAQILSIQKAERDRELLIINLALRPGTAAKVLG